LSQGIGRLGIATDAKGRGLSPTLNTVVFNAHKQIGGLGSRPPADREGNPLMDGKGLQLKVHDSF
jgi:hypothetical protein